MWSWNQFRNLPKNQGLSNAEKSRQYFIYHSNMMYETIINNNNIEISTNSSGRIINKISTFTLKSNRNEFSIYIEQGEPLEGELVIDWGDGVIDKFINQDNNQFTHIYDKQNENTVNVRYKIYHIWIQRI